MFIFILYFNPIFFNRTPYFIVGATAHCIMRHLQRQWNGYATPVEPDCWVLISATTAPIPPPDAWQLTQPFFRAQHNTFSMGPDLISGTTEPDKKRITINLSDTFFDHPIANIWQHFIYRLYHTVCHWRNRRSFFLHACAVAAGKQGLVCTGPHQVGKTTVARTSALPVLHDDQVIITLQAAGPCVHSAPLPAQLCTAPAMKLPIAHLLVLAQDHEFALERMPPAEACAAIYQEMVLPLGLEETDAHQARQNRAAWCAELLGSVSVRRLHFDREGRFWTALLRVMEGKG